jgi:hypothetical protein
MATRPKSPASDRALAVELHVSHGVIGQWRTKFPGETPATRDMQQWRDFMEERGLANANTAPAAALAALRAAKLDETLERVRRLKRENSWGDGVLVKRADIDQLFGQIAGRQKMILYAKMESELPAQLEGLDIVTVRRRLRDAADEICSAMQEMLRNFVFEGPPRVPDAATVEGRLKTSYDET